MEDFKRLIEEAFPLEQASLDSVHEKNVRHGHISTLHVWPARRPLAACRAALIATLLPDPGNKEERDKLIERIGGVVRKYPKKKKMPSGKVEEILSKETVGGILHWGRESNPDIQWFRQEICKAYGGRAPKVLDPFAGGGAIPLEAMRLGCEATAIDINPVAWFILKCTLEYPQKLAGQFRPLPKFALESPEFMARYFKATSKLTKKQLERSLHAVQTNMFPAPDVDLSWHVRAWGWWILQQAKEELWRFYPTVDGKPTVAYLWARTVTCKNCRATIPLLKTRWLTKKDKKRVLLTMEPNENKTGVVFGVQNKVPVVGKNAAQRREHDKRVGAGTMSRSGAYCPCCGKPDTAAMTMEDIRLEGQAGRLGTVMTAVVVDGDKGKEYHLPSKGEVRLAAEAKGELDRVFADIPYGIPTEPLASKGALGFRVPLYGFDSWNKLFTSRQLLALGTFVKQARAATDAIGKLDYGSEWREALVSYLAAVVDKLADRSSSQCIWISTNAEKASGSFGRFAMPITWDFVEVMPWSGAAGGYAGNLEHIAETIKHATDAATDAAPRSLKQSALQPLSDTFDVVVTDPPYYAAIPYSDLMDFFYIWLRRTLQGTSVAANGAFEQALAPKWDVEKKDGELIDDESRFGGDSAASKAAYEDGMARAFLVCQRALAPGGRMVVVFANKQPDAWETLVGAMVKAGFVVDGSWPIQTERSGRIRAQTSAALSSSVWLVCRKRTEEATLGWDNKVLEEMGVNIKLRLREYWDAGIRGPDFVWAATGPALETYSKHPVVKKANEPGQVMTVTEFLQHVRRIVVEFVVGRVLTHDGGAESVSGLDDVTTYYLLHRHDFGLNEAPAGACILYAISCGLSDTKLAGQYDLLVRTGGKSAADESKETGGDEGEESGSGSKVRLKTWRARKTRLMRELALDAGPQPMIDHVHRMMHLWAAGDRREISDYVDRWGLRKDALFHKLLQALIELAGESGEERSCLESISNYITGEKPKTDWKRSLDGMEK